MALRERITPTSSLALESFLCWLQMHPVSKVGAEQLYLATPFSSGAP